MQTTNQQEEYAPEELLISRMAKEMRGEMVGGAATYCSMVAVKLAQSLYNPDLIDMSGGLHHFDSRTPMAFLAAESLGRGSAKARVSSGWAVPELPILSNNGSWSWPGRRPSCLLRPR